MTLTPGLGRRVDALPGVRVDVPAAPIVVPRGRLDDVRRERRPRRSDGGDARPDPTLSLTQASFAPLSNRFWMSEASGVVTLAGGAGRYASRPAARRRPRDSPT